MDYKIDYLRFSIIPQFEIKSRLLFVDFIIHTVLGMHDKLYDFQTSKCGGFYDFKFFYHNIYIKVPPDDNPGEGYQVEMTGEGYDYFIEYRLNLNSSFTERTFFSNLISLSELNSFKVNFTRLDIAIDDKSYTDKGLLDFSTIRESVLNGSVITRFRHRTVVYDGEVQTSSDRNTPYIIYEKGSSRSKLKGSTIYLGSRSHSHCRFYDKISEMQAHQKEYDTNLKHWFRFEVQLCHDNAAFLVTRLVSLQPADFSKFLSGYFLNLVSFVDAKEKLASNYYRCSIVSWWAKFLGTVEKSSLVHIKPKVNRYARSVKWIKKSVAASALAVIKSVGFQNFCGILKEGALEHYRSDRHDLIVDDYIHYGNYEVDPLSGVDAYKVYFSDDTKFRDFLIEMRHLREDTVLQEMKLQEADQLKFQKFVVI